MLDITFQSEHFNNATHQYKQELLVSPPRYVREEIGLMISYIPEHVHRIIDFGCGTGRLTIPLLRMGYTVRGMDISSDSLAQIYKNVQKIVPRHLSSFSSDTQLPKEKWDAVMGTDVLHHVDLNIELPKIRAALRPGGIAVFSEPNAWNIAWYIFLSMFNSWKAEEGLMHCSIPNLLRSFIASGFHDVTFVRFGFIPPIILNFFPPLQKLNYYIAQLPFFNLFAYRLIIVARV